MSDKKSKGIIKYVSAAFFSVVMAVGFVMNLGELAVNRTWLSDDGSLRIRAAFNELEAVDAIKYPFININGLYQSALQRHYMYEVDSANDLIKTRDGYLSSNTSQKADRKKLEATADAFLGTKKKLESKGIPLLYVQSATKGAVSPYELMTGIENNSYDKVETFLGMLRKRGIEVLDSRAILSEGGMEAFFRTDHHWTIESAFKVAEAVTERLNGQPGIETDGAAMKEENWNRKTYEESFLGAEGRRTGIYYTGLDDFTVYTPDFRTSFALSGVNRYGETFERKGSFEDTIMDLSKDPSKYSFEDSAYYIYWGGDYGRVSVDNRELEDGPSIMIVKDSFGVPVSAFMACSFDRVEVIDARYYKGSIEAAVDEAKPDAVVYIYGAGYFEKPSSFRID